ncbi:MAG: hydrogenase maturation protease [Chitinophagaceae bacterium]|jgi:hydrogenase maturation protease|nr:hydrogenase maturation protease [Chitinophagaceae bacterium]
MISEPKILIAGVGNELRQDDAFGVLLAQKLQQETSFPPSVKVMEIGSGGIHLVQQLFDKYDVLILLDIVKWGGAAGTIHFKEVEVKDITQLPKDEQNEFLADMHYINPLKALMMAKALNVLPRQVLFLGCESEEHEEIGIGMSSAVEEAIPVAVKKIEDWVMGINKSVSIDE